MPNPSPGNGESWFKWALIWFFRILIGVPVILAIPFRESAKFLKEHVYDKKHPIRRRICGAAFGVLLGAGAAYYLGLAPNAVYSSFGFWWYPVGLAIAASVYFYAFPIVFGILESVYEFARPYFDQLFTAIWNLVSTVLRGIWRVIRWFFRKLGSLLRWFWDSWAVVFENAYNLHHSRLVLHQVNLVCALAILLGGIWYGSTQSLTWLSSLYIAGAVLAAGASYLVAGSLLLLVGNWFVGASVGVGSGFLAHHYLQTLLPSSWAIGVSIGLGIAVFGVIYPLCCEALRKSLQAIGLYEPLERALIALHVWAWRTLGNLLSSFWRAIRWLWTGFWNVVERIWTRLMSVVEWFGNKWLDVYRAAYHENWQGIPVHGVNLGIAIVAVAGGIWFAFSLNSQLLVVLAMVASVLVGLVLYLVLGSILLALKNRFVGFALAVAAGYVAHRQLQVADSTWAVLGGIAAGIATYLVVYPVVCAALIKTLQLLGQAEGTLSLLDRVHNRVWERSLDFLSWVVDWISWGWTQLCLFADWLGGWIAYGWNQFVRFVRWVGRGIAHAYRYVRTQLRRFLSWSWAQVCRFANWAWAWIVWGWTQLCLFADWLGGWIAYGWNQFVKFVRWVGRGIAHVYRYARKQVRRFLSWSWTKLCQFGTWLRGWIVWGWTQLCRFADWAWSWIAYG
ncbi:MAG: hypothetical protein K2W82_13945, partial [Candidatus Obscuribacterales bacterium]|nr:hypothetical protein [Candidatus Obscuribacterales bacterium]